MDQDRGSGHVWGKCTIRIKDLNKFKAILVSCAFARHRLGMSNRMSLLLSIGTFRVAKPEGDNEAYFSFFLNSAAYKILRPAEGIFWFRRCNFGQKMCFFFLHKKCKY